jgi:hypothetical protein
MTVHRLTAAIFALSLCCLTGCAAMMQTSKLPDGYAMREIAKADRNRPFDVSRSGKVAAVCEGAIGIIERDGAIRKIVQGTPAQLRFSPSGERLAALFTVEKEKQKHYLLRIYDLNGKILGEAAIPEPVTSLAWRSDSQLLAAGVSIRKFSFGSSMTSHLYAWDGSTAPVVTTLSSSTIRPQAAKLPDETLQKTLVLAVSPYQDEIAYTTLKDPPLFSPYLRIAARHLDSGAEREILQTSVGSGTLLYAPDAESIIVGDSGALTRRISAADGREMDAFPAAGNNAAISPSGNYLFLDGRLFEKGKEIAWFPTTSRGSFLPDGSGLVISYQEKLYQLSGLEEQAKPLPADRDGILKLRRLRAEGLITEKDYRAQKEKVTGR